MGCFILLWATESSGYFLGGKASSEGRAESTAREDNCFSAFFRQGVWHLKVHSQELLCNLGNQILVFFGIW